MGAIRVLNAGGRRRREALHEGERSVRDALPAVIDRQQVRAFRESRLSVRPAMVRPPAMVALRFKPDASRFRGGLAFDVNYA
jgi:hypothetical protein